MLRNSLNTLTFHSSNLSLGVLMRFDIPLSYLPLHLYLLLLLFSLPESYIMSLSLCICKAACEFQNLQQEYSFFTFWKKFSFNSITSVRRFFHFSSFVTISCVEPPITQYPLLLFSKIFLFFFIFSFQPFSTVSWTRQSVCCHVLQAVVVALPTVTFSSFFFLFWWLNNSFFSSLLCLSWIGIW